MTAPARRSELTAAYRSLTARVATAADDAGRAPGEITLVAVTKFFPATDVAALAEAGCRNFGEARDQEAAAKITELVDAGTAPLRWHMVGTLQRNKARSVARWAAAVHSVDSLTLTAALERGASAALASGDRDQPLEVFVQLSLDGDTARGGVDVGQREAVEEVCDAVAATTGLRLVGLMAIPPRASDADAAFAVLQTEHQRVLERHPGATQLSAGMSDDWESAVRHGATVVRVGTALMGPRPLASPPAVTPVTPSSPPDTRP